MSKTCPENGLQIEPIFASVVAFFASGNCLAMVPFLLQANSLNHRIFQYWAQGGRRRSLHLRAPLEFLQPWWNRRPVRQELTRLCPQLPRHICLSRTSGYGLRRRCCEIGACMVPKLCTALSPRVCRTAVAPARHSGIPACRTLGIR